MAVKVLLDTDIGTDIDDAICLTYLLANPECELLGITTVTGEPEKRAMLASSLCMLAGKEIPIFPGTANPLIIEQQQNIAKQAESLHKWSHRKNFPNGEAIEFMKSVIRANPGEVVLITIGPLTNIALLFKTDEEIPSLLKGLVMMCGYFEHRVTGWNKLEWNAKGDYHASRIVYNSDVPVHRSVGIDVTSQVTMTSGEFKEKFGKEIFRPLQDYVKHWYDYSDIITFHDPLAAATVFNKDICGFVSGNVTIENNDPDLNGLTNFEKRADGRHEVALNVNKDEFFKEYFSVF